MTPEKKQVVKVVALTAGIALIIAAIVIIIVVRKKKAQEEDPMPYQPNYSPSKASSSASSPRYTTQEVERMQSYLFNMGAMAMNEYIVKRIRETGGIDGVIGDGFNDALKEAIKIGLVSSLNDLYEKSKVFANT